MLIWWPLNGSRSASNIRPMLKDTVSCRSDILKVLSIGNARQMGRACYSAAFAMLAFSFSFSIVSQLVKPVKLSSSKYSTVPSQMNR